MLARCCSGVSPAAPLEESRHGSCRRIRRLDAIANRYPAAVVRAEAESGQRALRFVERAQALAMPERVLRNGVRRARDRGPPGMVRTGERRELAVTQRCERRVVDGSQVRRTTPADENGQQYRSLRRAVLEHARREQRPEDLPPLDFWHQK